MMVWWLLTSLIHIPISLFTIGACRPEDRQTGLAEQELTS
ncbi:MAG: hypothetical protein OJF51_004577 [Nitrospira sp.]|nr:MAG: hypothetical protein OJF51_004577 [Nitrospira sp.]